MSKRRLVVAGQAVFTSYALPAAGRLSLGRSEKSDVRVEDDSISRKHARLHIGSRLEIEDLGSVNGTRVHGQRLATGQRVAVLPGEPFHIGSVTVIIVVDSDTAQSEAPPSEIETRRGFVGSAKAAEASPRSNADAEPIVEDPAMRALYATAAKMAAGSIPVLVLGETGAGKELVARTVHERSPRHAAPFVSLNCAALAEPLLDAELFGYVRGAFTGADQDKPGLLEAAHGGTLFLDEVGEMPLALQAKLLRAIDLREVLRVGTVTPRKVDVRFVAATNRDLQGAIAQGKFRSDLFFRLSGSTLVIPPLRERTSEIEPLAKAFAARAARELGRNDAPAMSPEAANLLRAYHWPGNVRELRHFVERAVLLSEGPTLSAEHFPVAQMTASLPLHTIAAPPAPDAQGERERILEVLRACGGNQSRAAKELGIARSTLVLRLESYGVPRPRK